MDRRNFIHRIAAAGAVPAAAASAKGKTKTAKFKVTGFSCVTCAVGLETMMKNEPGVAAIRATYPAGDVVIDYDPAITTTEALAAFIQSTGFGIKNPA